MTQIKCNHYNKVLEFSFTLSTKCLTKRRDPHVVSGSILVGECQCFLKGKVQPEIKYFVIIFRLACFYGAFYFFELGGYKHHPLFCLDGNLDIFIFMLPFI